MPDETAERFTTVSERLGISASELIAMVVAHAVATGGRMRQIGLSGIARWGNRDGRIGVVVQESTSALPTDIRPSGFMWPADKPFAWTAEECRAAVIGCEVRWPGSPDGFTNQLRGRWEMADGYAVLWQS